VKTIEEVEAWAESVGLVYQIFYGTHELVLLPMMTIFCLGENRATFIENANELRRWYEARNEA